MQPLIPQLCLLISTICLVQTIPVEPRLSLAEVWNSYYHTDTNGPGGYTFGYDLEDQSSGNVQYRVEEKYPNGTVMGSYGLLEPDGNIKVVKYVADDSGYRATVEDSNKKYPRYHPPLTSRNEEERDLDNSVRAPSMEGLSLLQAFGPFSQSIQEIRTPPKYQNALPDNNLYLTEWPGN